MLKIKQKKNHYFTAENASESRIALHVTFCYMEIIKVSSIYYKYYYKYQVKVRTTVTTKENNFCTLYV